MCLYLGMGLPVVVAATDFQGILEVENSPSDYSRDVAWRILKRGVMILGTPANPGHQVGAALAIRLGLEAAAKMGYTYLLHTAEDVMPRQAARLKMRRALEEGADYAGEPWLAGPGQLNSQYFACRVDALAGAWDACAVTTDGCIERYLGRLLEGKKVAHVKESYRTTHDRGQWLGWRDEEGY